MRTMSCASRVSRTAARTTPLYLLASVVLPGSAILAGGVPDANGTAKADMPAELPRHALVAMRTIQGKAIVEHASFLCKPELAGRKAGTHGARKASHYIAERFRKIGLQPGGNAGSYFQTFKIRAGYHISSELVVARGSAKKTYQRRAEYMPIHIPRDRAEMDVPCALAGYGISSPQLRFDEYSGLNVTNKAVLVFTGVPWGAATAAWLWRLEKQRRESLAYKAQAAAEHGAKLLLVVDDPAGWRRRLAYSEQLGLPDRGFPLRSPIPVIHITRSAATHLAGMSQKDLEAMARRIHLARRPQSTDLAVRLTYKGAITGSSRIGRNVIGVLPGGDRELRKQAIVIGAHYDHLGEGVEGVFFGANDNAAGVGAVLGIARTFKSLPDPPRRTVIFVAFAAEEIGKLGSSYYVDHPCLPIKDTALMINFDMIGRNEEDAINAVATRSSSELHEIHQSVNRAVGLKLVHPANFRIGRSDHTAFYLADVPVMYLFGGLHADYNTTEDTVEKLIPRKIERVARLAFLTAYVVSEKKRRIAFDWSSEDTDLPVMRYDDKVFRAFE